MWYNNRLVNRTYCSSGNQFAWAIINGVAGWKRIQTGASDGVSNVLTLLSQAKANNRRVNVFISGNQIQRVVLL